MLGSAEASKIQAGNYQSDGCSYSPWKSCHAVQCRFARFGRRHLLLQQLWIVRRTPTRPGGEYSDEVVNETEALAVEVEAVDFP